MTTETPRTDEMVAALKDASIPISAALVDRCKNQERDLRECVELLRKARAEMRRLAGTGDEDFELLAEIDAALSTAEGKP